MQYNQCIVYYVLYSMHCILCMIFYAMYSRHCIPCFVLYALYSMYQNLCIVSYTHIQCIIIVVFLSLYSMNCTLCIWFYVFYALFILCILFYSNCTICIFIYIVFYGVSPVHSILCIVFYALYSTHYILCIVFYALYYMHCILCIVIYKLYSMHCNLCILYYVCKLLNFETCCGQTDQQTDWPTDQWTFSRIGLLSQWKCHEPGGTSCKITTLTNKNWGNESKIHMTSQNCRFFAVYFPLFFNFWLIIRLFELIFIPPFKTVNFNRVDLEIYHRLWKSRWLKYRF